MLEDFHVASLRVELQPDQMDRQPEVAVLRRVVALLELGQRRAAAVLLPHLELEQVHALTGLDAMSKRPRLPLSSTVTATSSPDM